MSVQNLVIGKNMSNGKKRKATIDVGNIKSNDILLRQKKIDILKRLREKHN